MAELFDDEWENMLDEEEEEEGENLFGDNMDLLVLIYKLKIF